MVALPLVIFIVLAGFLFVGLWRDPREVPSPLVGKPAPSFTKAHFEDTNGKVLMSYSAIELNDDADEPTPEPDAPAPSSKKRRSKSKDG